MYRSLLLSAAISSSLFLTSCREESVRGTGNITTEQRSPGADFDYIRSEVSLDLDIRVVPGSKPSVSLTGYPNVLEHIELRNEGNKLVISSKKNHISIHSDKKLKATITVPSLAGVDIQGSSDAMITGTIAGKELALNVDGAGDISLDTVRVEHLSVDVAGSSTINIKGGSVVKGDYSIKGAGDLRAQELSNTEAKVEIAGAGDASLTAGTRLDVDVKGAGTVKYKGHPSISQDVAGAGSVQDVN